MSETPDASPRPPFKAIDEIPGWFQRMDMEIFKQLLDHTGERLGGGDLAELGAYLGKSAALIGWAKQPGETFTVIDLFEQEATAEENRAENEDQYADLSQEAFEKYYLTVNDSLPNVVRGPSATIVDHAAHGTHRFVHIDASHLYEHVVEDIAAARTLLKPGGVVVFDDFRAPHTPGVAAAVWRATTEDLRPFAVTMNKLYATFDDSQQWFDVLTDWLDERSFWRREVQQVAGHRIVRVLRPAKKAAGVATAGVATAAEAASEPATEPPVRRSRLAQLLGKSRR
ncbi:MAG: class I SAM-dependent methyltransferase [Marmoricola sp.]